MKFATDEPNVFNYSDIFFSCYTDNERGCWGMVEDHTLVYVRSGEIVLEEGNTTVKIRKGECVFLRKDNRVSLTKQPGRDEKFIGISLVFKRDFLRKFYQVIDKKKLPLQTRKHARSVISLPQTPAIASLFQSMMPYFDSSTKPTERIIDMKLQEGVYALLEIDEQFYPNLFDFTDPWKIDVLDFMEKNYAYNLTIQDMAHYTGRSVATFKRDFKKVSNLSPQKWLMEKRLNVAQDKLLHEHRKVSEVYLEVGFKNISHFSTAYKKKFGHSPSSITV
ncbi:MAG: AraC family transcriptional regulator [Parabacteroides sp.]|nr:AraC family transcriptional regulator [Parabacteroides sp.]